MTLKSGYLEGAQRCPYCDKILDGCTDSEQQVTKPSPGDFAICIDCKTVLVYEQRLESSHFDLRLAKRGDIIELTAQKSPLTICNGTGRYFVKTV